MTTAMLSPLVHTTRPSYEGANIRTWVGFKHFMYLVEESVLAWLREQGHPAGALYHTYGLGAEIVDCSVQLPAVLDVDDAVRAEVVHTGGGTFKVRLLVWRDGQDVVVLRATVTLALIRERDADHHREPPPELRELVHDNLPASGAQPGELAIPAEADVAGVLTPADSGAYLWSWRAPYFYCHFSDRVQHSGFVRCLEEVVDRFLADRGMSVARMLRERSWIPVVSRARLRLVAAAHMEETIHTVFTVENILRSTMFDARMDCYVRREGSLQLVATGSILHGYAVSRGPDAGGLATLDDEVCARLGGQQS